jgi:hypothetical protein
MGNWSDKFMNDVDDEDDTPLRCWVVFEIHRNGIRRNLCAFSSAADAAFTAAIHLVKEPHLVLGIERLDVLATPAEVMDLEGAVSNGKARARNANGTIPKDGEGPRWRVHKRRGKTAMPFFIEDKDGKAFVRRARGKATMTKYWRTREGARQAADRLNSEAS